MLFGLLQTVELRLGAVVAEGLALVEPDAADGADPGVLGAVRAVAGADDRPAAAGVGADAVRAALPVAESGGLLPAETGGKEQAAEQFSFLLNAFRYGVPPHAGLAYGLDRVVMMMLGLDSIRDVIAFPKVKDSSDLMTQAPGEVSPAQLEELGISIIKS